MNELYREKVPSTIIVTAILFLSILIIAIALISQFTNRAVPLTAPMKIILVVIFLLATVVLISFRYLTIVVTETQMIFGFGKFRRKTNLADLEWVKIDEYKFSNYWGYGIRFGRDGSIGYTPHGGKGVRLKFKNEKREYFLVSDRADELKALLEKQIHA